MNLFIWVQLQILHSRRSANLSESILWLWSGSAATRHGSTFARPQNLWALSCSFSQTTIVLQHKPLHIYIHIICDAYTTHRSRVYPCRLELICGGERSYQKIKFFALPRPLARFWIECVSFNRYCLGCFLMRCCTRFWLYRSFSWHGHPAAWADKIVLKRSSRTMPEPRLVLPPHPHWPFNMPSLNASLGAIELGILFSTMLLGLLIVQCYTYHQAEFKDGWLIRSLVSVLFWAMKFEDLT